MAWGHGTSSRIQQRASCVEQEGVCSVCGICSTGRGAAWALRIAPGPRAAAQLVGATCPLCGRRANRGQAPGVRLPAHRVAAAAGCTAPLCRAAARGAGPGRRERPASAGGNAARRLREPPGRAGRSRGASAGARRGREGEGGQRCSPEPSEVALGVKPVFNLEQAAQAPGPVHSEGRAGAAAPRAPPARRAPGPHEGVRTAPGEDARKRGLSTGWGCSTDLANVVNVQQKARGKRQA
mmetsp:Transcript_5962/g.18502  ORF Transcript_5962/g.18502 Transcript_5962/m.18502 type:complete len:238 (-) Transcript_5962:8-721(-)